MLSKDDTIRLFGSNNHSIFDIGWNDVVSDTQIEIRELLANNYEVGSAVEIKQVDAWERNSNNFKINTDANGTYLLRKNIKDERDTILFAEKVSAHLKKNSAPTPGIIPDKSGEPYITSGKHFWQLFEFIPGDHFRGTEDELREVGRQVGKLHNLLETFQFNGERPIKTDWSLSKWKGILERAREAGSSIDRIVNENQKLLLDETEYVAGARKSYSNLRRQFVHLDLHPHNVIFEDGRLRAFLDFGDVNLSELARDIGQACHRFVRQYIVYQNGNWRELLGTGVAIFLDEYRKENELGKIDFHAMPLLIKDELLRRMYSDLRRHYEEGNSRLVGGGELEKKFTLLQETVYLEKAISNII